MREDHTQTPISSTCHRRPELSRLPLAGKRGEGWGMIIGIPKETKAQEHRVGLLPGAAHHLAKRGHSVLVENGAGVGRCRCGGKLPALPVSAEGCGRLSWKRRFWDSLRMSRPRFTERMISPKIMPNNRRLRCVSV